MCKGPGASPEHEENCKPEPSILGNTLGGEKSQPREVSRKRKDTASKAWLRGLGFIHRDKTFGAGRLPVSRNPGLAGNGAQYPGPKPNQREASCDLQKNAPPPPPPPCRCSLEFSSSLPVCS